MGKTKILVMVGGLCRDSLNRQLFGNVRKLYGDKFEFDEVDIAAIPYYSQDLEKNLPAAVKDLKERIAACDGVLFVTPEYNRSFPGVLKNAVDWGSRPYGNNSWTGKPAAIIGATPGNICTFGAQNHLRQVLTGVSIRTMDAPQFYYSSTGDMEDGKLSENSTAYLKEFMGAFEDWMAKLK